MPSASPCRSSASTSGSASSGVDQSHPDAESAQLLADPVVLGQRRHELQHPVECSEEAAAERRPDVDGRDPDGHRLRRAVGQHDHLVLQRRHLHDVGVVEQLRAHQREGEVRRALEHRVDLVAHRPAAGPRTAYRPPPLPYVRGDTYPTMFV